MRCGSAAAALVAATTTLPGGGRRRDTPRMRYLVPAGGTAVFLLFLVSVLLIHAPPAGAQEPETIGSDSFTLVFVSVDIYTYPALFMLAAVVAVTLAGLVALRAADPWPLWPALVRGLGDAAFLFAIIATFAGLREAMLTLARIGGAVTPADVAAGLARSLSDLVLGAVVAFAGLCGAAVLRWRMARGALTASRRVVETFS